MLVSTDLSTGELPNDREIADQFCVVAVGPGTKEHGNFGVCAAGEKKAEQEGAHQFGIRRTLNPAPPESAAPTVTRSSVALRSEERRVGKDCRSTRSPSR